MKNKLKIERAILDPQATAEKLESRDNYKFN
jgi:hypothetical protein